MKAQNSSGLLRPRVITQINEYVSMVIAAHIAQGWAQSPGHERQFILPFHSNVYLLKDFMYFCRPSGRHSCVLSGLR